MTTLNLRKYYNTMLGYQGPTFYLANSQSTVDYYSILNWVGISVSLSAHCVKMDWLIFSKHFFSKTAGSWLASRHKIVRRYKAWLGSEFDLNKIVMDPWMSGVDTAWFSLCVTRYFSLFSRISCPFWRNLWINISQNVNLYINCVPWCPRKFL